MERYVHGYTDREEQRLRDQAGILMEMLHRDVRYPAGARVLEAGCGVGAQTVTLARHNPGAHITAIDISAESIAAARLAVAAAGLDNVTFRQGDILAEPFPEASFDHIFLCFVLEHLPRPEAALASLRRMLCPDGSITAIEGDHGSAYFHPHSDHAARAIRCQVELQARAGGDACIGRRLYPLLSGAGFREPRVEPKVVYADAGRPEWVEGFTLNTFTAMIEGVGANVVAAGLMSREDFSRGVSDLRLTAGPEGTFSYTFFKGTALR